MAGNFDEKSGIIYSASTWGRWGQTIEDVQIFVDVAKGTSPKEIKCKIGSKTLSIIVKGKTVLEVTFWTKLMIRLSFKKKLFETRQ